MEEPKKKTRIAAVADVHFRETDKGKWTEYFKEVSAKADVCVTVKCCYYFVAVQGLGQSRASQKRKNGFGFTYNGVLNGGNNAAVQFS